MEKENYWSRFADDFEERNNYVAGEKNIDAIREALRGCAIAGEVLELGCGNGTYSRILAKTAERVLATDFSDEMVAVSEARLKQLENVRVAKQNALDLSLPDGKFDTVVMANLLHVIPQPKQAIRESCRVIRDGGELIVISFTTEGISLFSKLAMIYRYLRTYGKPPETAQTLTLASTKEMLEAEGFSVRDAQLVGGNCKAVFVRALRK